MDKRALIDLVNKTPQYQQAMSQIKQKLANSPVMSGDVKVLIKFIEAVIDHPDKYNQLLMVAIHDGKLKQGDLPDTYNPNILIPLLAVLYGLKDHLGSEGYAKGGLTRLAAQGRGSDTIVAHINKREAEMLKNAGGSGTINPKTGLPEYGFLSTLLSFVMPAVVDFFAPGIGEAISGLTNGALGTTTSAILGTALTGAAGNALGAALTGGNVGQSALQGGLLGAVSGGLGDVVGSKINDVTGMKLGPTGQSILGGALVGGLGGWAQNKDLASSLLQGGIGGGLSGYAKANPTMFDTSGSVAKGLQSGVSGIGHMLTAGLSPQQALIGGALKGVASGALDAFSKPSDTAVKNLENMPMNSGDTQKAFDNALSSNPKDFVSAASSPSSSSGSGGFDLNKMLMTGALGVAGTSLLGGSSAPAGQTTTSATVPLSQAQIDYLNRPSQTFDWEKIQEDAQNSGMPVAQFLAKNWNEVSEGKYYKPNMATGGALNNIARFAQGSGTGRDDTIDAKLSDGEYVIDAETVAMLGDGSNKAGALKLDQMRREIRKQKGKALAKGKFSPNAKSPLTYIKGAI